MNCLNITVSYFNKFNEEKATDVNLYKLLTTPDPKGLEIQNKIREVTNEHEQKKLKLEAPCYTISGKFKASHSMNDLINHTGLIAIDVDRKDNTHLNPDEFAEVKKILTMSPYVAYIGNSIRGEGYFVILPISNPEKHEQHFLMVEELFRTLPKPVYVDSQCRNVNRLRFYSYDPNAYINTNAKSLPLFSSWSKPPRTNAVKWNHTNSIDKSDFEQQINAIKIDITGDYNQWLKIGFAIASEFGERGEDYFHRISQFSPHYNWNDCHQKYFHCCKSKRESGGITIATFYHYCKQYGIEMNRHAIVDPNYKIVKSNHPPLLNDDDKMYQSMLTDNPQFKDFVDVLDLVNPATMLPYRCK